MKRFFTEHKKHFGSCFFLHVCFFWEEGLEPLYTDCICNRK